MAAVEEQGKALDLAQKEKKAKEDLAAQLGRMTQAEQNEAERLLKKQQSGSISKYEIERLEKLIPALRDITAKSFAGFANQSLLDAALGAQGKKTSTEIDKAADDAAKTVGLKQGETSQQAVERLKAELKRANDALDKTSASLMSEHIKRTNEHEKELQALKVTLQRFKQQQV